MSQKRMVRLVGWPLAGAALSLATVVMVAGAWRRPSRASVSALIPTGRVLADGREPAGAARAETDTLDLQLD